MKSLIMALIILAGSASFAAGNEHNYKCIAGTLQATDSDYYWDLSPEQIDELLNNKGIAGHSFVVEVTKNCDSQIPWIK